MVKTTTIITTPLDAGGGNRGGNLTAITQGDITTTQKKYGRGSNSLTLQPHPRPTERTTAGEASYAAGSVGANSAGGGETIANNQPVGYLEISHTEHLPSATGTIRTATAKDNNHAKQWALATTLHQFLTDGNINLQDLNGDYKHFTALVAVPGTYMTKVTYSQRIGAAGIGQVSPVAKKLLVFFGKGGGGLVLEQAISSHKPCGTPSGSKILRTVR